MKTAKFYYKLKTLARPTNSEPVQFSPKTGLSPEVSYSLNRSSLVLSMPFFNSFFPNSWTFPHIEKLMYIFTDIHVPNYKSHFVIEAWLWGWRHLEHQLCLRMTSADGAVQAPTVANRPLRKKMCRRTVPRSLDSF